MKPAARCYRGILSAFCAVLRGRGGAVTVEVALVLLPFLIVTCMTMELVLIEFYQARFSNAVYLLGRAMRTGNEASVEASNAALSTPIDSKTTMLQALCTNMNFPAPMVGATPASCAASSYLSVVVQIIPKGTAITSGTFSSGVKLGSLTPTSYPASPASCNLVVVQGFFSWPILIPLNAAALKTASLTSGSYFLMSAATVFQDEPAAKAFCSGIGS